MRPLSNPCFVVLCAALGFGLFLNVLDNGFVNHDDGRVILGNAAMYDGINRENIREIFVENYPREEPFIVRDLSYLVNAHLFGVRNPFGYLLGNVIFHLGATLLFYALSLRLFGRAGVCQVAAVLFLIHPVHVESIAWISARKDTLSTCFLLLSFLCYVKASGKGLSWLVAATGCYVLAMLAKINTVFLPGLLLIYHLWRRDPLRVALPRLVPMLICGMLCTLWYGRMISQYGGIIKDVDTGSLKYWAVWALTNAEAIAEYVGVLLLPLRLCVMPDYPDFTYTLERPERIVLAAAILCGCAILVWRLRGKRWTSVFLAGWFIVSLLPFMNVMFVGIWYAERYLYVPSMAYCLAVGLVAARLWERGRSRFRRGLLAVLLAGYAVFLCANTIQMNDVWQDDISLWTHNVEVSRNLNGYIRLVKARMEAGSEAGTASDRAGRLVEAEDVLDAFFEEVPGRAVSSDTLADAFWLRGDLLYFRGEEEEARKNWSMCLAISPNHEEAKKRLK